MEKLNKKNNNNLNLDNNNYKQKLNDIYSYIYVLYYIYYIYKCIICKMPYYLFTLNLFIYNI